MLEETCWKHLADWMGKRLVRSRSTLKLDRGPERLREERKEDGRREESKS